MVAGLGLGDRAVEDAEPVPHAEVVELAVRSPGGPGGPDRRSLPAGEQGAQRRRPAVHVAAEDGGAPCGGTPPERAPKESDLTRRAMDQVRHVDAGDLDLAARGGDLDHEDPSVGPITPSPTEVEDADGPHLEPAHDGDAPRPLLGIGEPIRGSEATAERELGVHVQGVVSVEEGAMAVPVGPGLRVRQPASAVGQGHLVHAPADQGAERSRHRRALGVDPVLLEQGDIRSE